MNQLAEFTGPGWEQEDDVTLLTLEYVQEHASVIEPDSPPESEERSLLGEFSLPSEPGNELLAVEGVVELVKEIELEKGVLERLKTAVAETTMNAIEHGNRYQEDLAVEIQVLRSSTELVVRIRDHGGGRPIPQPEMPDLEAKLAGLQSPRGWGLFLIKHMVDEMNVQVDEVHHTVELIFKLEGKQP
jgi:anti-sigma regulatory factor (Ser/Thr protein kinase)